MMTTLKWLIGMVLLSVGFSAQPDEAGIRPNAIQLKGSLGDKYPIEMQLLRPLGEDFFPTSGECVDVRGTYYYKNKALPILVQGKFCVKDYTFSLDDSFNKGPVNETFEGKWDPKTRTLTGNWTLKSTGKALPFTLASTELDYSTEEYQQFFQYIRRELQGTGEDKQPYGAWISDAQWDAQGGHIDGFSAEWNGEVEELAAGRLKYSTWYNSTDHSENYTYTYQLLPNTKVAYILRVEEVNYYQKEYKEDANGGMEMAEGTSSGSFSIFLTQYNEGDFHDVGEVTFPYDFPIYGDYIGKDNEVTIPQIEVLQDRILVKQGDTVSKLKWDKKKFVAF